MNSKKLINISLVLLLLFLLPACSKRISMQEAMEQGNPRLSSDDIISLVAGQKLHIVTWDKSDEADVFFHSSGKLSAENTVGDKADGRWDVSSEDTLCIRYDDWAGGYRNCYSVFKVDESFKMFKGDGVLESSFTVDGGSVAELEFSGVGLGQSMPGSRQAMREEKRPPAIERQVKTSSWWQPGAWFEGEKQLPVPPQSDYVPEPPPLSPEMRHLLEDKECVSCDLSGKVIADASLKNADIEAINLSEADLSATVLKKANMKKANLADANLSRADLSGADLSGADLSGANLEEANLEGANLEGATLYRARLVDAVLSQAVLKNADLQGANLHWADLSKADLTGASLKDAYLVKTKFFKADLTGADLTDAVIQRTDFEGVKGYTPVVEGGDEVQEKKKVLGIF